MVGRGFQKAHWCREDEPIANELLLLAKELVLGLKTPTELTRY